MDLLGLRGCAAFEIPLMFHALDFLASVLGVDELFQPASCFLQPLGLLSVNIICTAGLILQMHQNVKHSLLDLGTQIFQYCP